MKSFFVSLILSQAVEVGHLAPVTICGPVVIFNSFVEVSMLSEIPFTLERPQVVRNVLVSHFRPRKEVSMTCFIFRRDGRLQFNNNTEISSVDQQT